MPGRYGSGMLTGGMGYDPISSSTDGLFPRVGRGNLDPVPGSVGAVPGSPVSTTMPVPAPGGGGGMPSPPFDVPGGHGGVLGLPPGGGGMGAPTPYFGAGQGPADSMQRGAIMDALKQYIGGSRGA